MSNNSSHELLLLEAENSLVLHSIHLNEYATHQKRPHSRRIAFKI